MNFQAKVKFEDSATAAELINAFFKDIFSSEEGMSPKNFIKIKGKEAEFNIYFSNTFPESVVSVLSDCEIITCTVSEDNETQEEKEQSSGNKQEKIPEKSSEAKAKEENVELTVSKQEEIPIKSSEAKAKEENVEPFGSEQEKTPEKSPKVKTEEGKEKPPLKRKNTKPKETNKEKLLHIPAIHEIAKKANSYKEFLISVANWIGATNEKQEFLMKLVYTATEVDKINWMNLQTMMGDSYNTYGRTYCTNLVNDKFMKTAPEVTILKFIKILANYKTFDFAVKTKEIPYLKEISTKVNSTDSIPKRIESALTFMGYKDSKEQNLIFRFVEAAFKLPEIDINSICTSIGISEEERSRVEMILSTFVNSFVRKYDPNNKIKVVDFLKELKSIIVF